MHDPLPKRVKEFATEVVATYGRHLLLRDGSGELHKARPFGRTQSIVCGDRVQCAFHGDELIVTGTMPRTTLLRRSTLRGRSEALAANLTQLAVVVAALPAPDLFIVDRYLCAAECAGLAALLVVNKNDLPGTQALQTGLDAHRLAGYAIISVSTQSAGAGEDTVAPLHRALNGHTTMLVGQSGVGKSSLTRVVAAEAIDIATGDLVRDEEGRHTTTASRLYDCSGGGRIIDSPGVRDFAPAIDDLEPATLGFREVARLAPDCRFLDCGHMQEPHCAVRAAASTGAMDSRRYESYRRLRRLYQDLWRRRPEREQAARR